MLSSFKKTESTHKISKIKASTTIINQYLLDIWGCQDFPIDRGDVCVKRTEGSLEWVGHACCLVLSSRYQVLIDEVGFEQKEPKRIELSDEQLESLYKKAKRYEILNECYELLSTREKRCQFIVEYDKLPVGIRQKRLVQTQTVSDVQRMISSLKKAGNQHYTQLVPELQMVCVTLESIKESKNALNQSR